MDRSSRIAIAVFVLVILLGAAPFTAPPAIGGTRDAPVVFSFGAVGDFGGAASTDMLALADRLRVSGASFLLSLGDLGYTADETAWCAAIKGRFNDVLVVAGNHDTTESGPGDIAQTVVQCPFTLGVPVTAGPGTPGYGYEYYFDYPAGSPLARFILISGGVGGQISYDYSAGSPHYNWVVDSVNTARSSGIPWVVVGMHKQCITVGAKTSCEMGQAIFDKLVDLRVDLILQGHDHVYERSKQLALRFSCGTVPAAGAFDPACVGDDGSDGSYVKGDGAVVVVQGTGGAPLYNVRIDGSDAEIGYFSEAMGGNTNTLGLTPGHGAVRYAVSSDAIAVDTDYCPAGGTDPAGACDATRATTFQDGFAIRMPSLLAFFSYVPTLPGNLTLRFDAGGSTDPLSPNRTLEVRWDFEADGVWDTSWSTERVASHRYAEAGTYTVRLEVRAGTTVSSTEREVVVGTGTSGGGPGGSAFPPGLVPLTVFAVIASAAVGVIVLWRRSRNRKRGTFRSPTDRS